MQIKLLFLERRCLLFQGALKLKFVCRQHVQFINTLVSNELNKRQESVQYEKGGWPWSSKTKAMPRDRTRVNTRGEHRNFGAFPRINVFSHDKYYYMNIS